MHERIVDLYEENAAAWAKLRAGTGAMERPWLDRFTASLPAGGSVLDVGCGNGEPIARYLCDCGFSVTGLDSSPSLIAMAQATFPDQRWIVGDMRELDFGRRFDGLIAWHSFFHLRPDDQRLMFARFAAHVLAGGALMFTSGPEHGEATGEWEGAPLYHGSLDPDEYRDLLAASGFELAAHETDDATCGGATVWLARKAA